MYASLRGGIDSLFDEGDYLSQITSVESVYFPPLHKKIVSKVPVLMFMQRRRNILLSKSQGKKQAKLKTQ